MMPNENWASGLQQAMARAAHAYRQLIDKWPRVSTTLLAAKKS